MHNGATVAPFEREFAAYVGAKYAIALVNGTATLHTALVALGVKPGDRVAVPPLTMSATTIAVLHAGAEPVFVDVESDTWYLGDWSVHYSCSRSIGVDLYGCHSDKWQPCSVSDAAQTLRRHNKHAPFTSYSFQASKVLALGEGGMLVTDDEGLATKAREFSSLGYRMRADQPRISPAVLKSPTYDRHHSLGFNYRMSDVVAERGLRAFDLGTVEIPGTDGAEEIYPCGLDALKRVRQVCAEMYREAIKDCEWLVPQHVPAGWTHDYWCYTVKIDDSKSHHGNINSGMWEALADRIEAYGGERPYACWKLTYQEPAFRHLAPDGTCPVAEHLQPRLMQFQCNNLRSAERNAAALRRALANFNAT